MKPSNFAIELAEFRTVQERDAGVARIQNELKAAGTVECIDCDHTIPALRRAKYPAARRCVGC